MFDRERAADDYHINVKAELEIELLHQKVDLMREQEIVKLIGVVEKLEQRLVEMARLAAEMILGIIKGNGKRPRQRKIDLGFRLVVRESSGKPPATRRDAT